MALRPANHQTWFFLVDLSVTKASIPANNGGTENGGNTPGNYAGKNESGQNNNGSSEVNEPGNEAPNGAGVTTYKNIEISGNVAIENWPYMFSSFIMPLKNNGLKIEVKITAENCESYPLTDNSATVKNVVESARQLNLNINKIKKE